MRKAFLNWGKPFILEACHAKRNEASIADYCHDRLLALVHQ